jgi:hypothetical protein
LKNAEHSKIDLTKEDKVRCYVDKWVMLWVKKHHPEVFETAKKFVEEYLNEVDSKN